MAVSLKGRNIGVLGFGKLETLDLDSLAALHAYLLRALLALF
jgi:hypothetical protein